MGVNIDILSDQCQVVQSVQAVNKQEVICNSVKCFQLTQLAITLRLLIYVLLADNHAKTARTTIGVLKNGTLTKNEPRMTIYGETAYASLLVKV